MSHNKAPQARLNLVAQFPIGYLLENLAVRSDNSVLLTAMNHKEVWHVPARRQNQETIPLRLHTFDELPTSLLEIEPEIFLIFTGNWYTTHESYAYRLDLRTWDGVSPLAPERLCQFPVEARGLNGSCLIGKATVLIADCFAGLIWRLDYAEVGRPSIRVWMQDDSMGFFPGKMHPEQPGINGIHYAADSQHLYYTCTAKKLLMRVRVDAHTLMPLGSPELVVAGRMGDDFCIDETGQVLYLTTHRQNTIDIVSMDPGLNSGFTQSVAGEPFSTDLIGPSSAAWSRAVGDYGRVLFCLTDGGTASPPPDGPRNAALLSVQLAQLPPEFPGSQP